jgi:hypothetical protein
MAVLGTALTMLPSQGFAANPSAAQSTTKACSTQYQAAKTAGTLNGEKWPQFLSDCSATMKGAANASAAPAAKTALSPKASTKVAKAAPAGLRTTQQICSSQYQAAKTAGTLGGQKWPDFLSTCSASIKNDKEDAGTAPPEPATTTASTTGAMSTKTRSASSSSGKALTPGETAFRERIHECSTEWQGEKSAGTLPAGSKWPQFWSACNTRLKAQG